MKKKLLFSVILFLFALTSVAYAGDVDGIWSIVDNDDDPNLFMLRENAGLVIMVTLDDLNGSSWSAYFGPMQDSVAHMTTLIDEDAVITLDLSFTTPAEGPIVAGTITVGTCTPKVPGGCEGFVGEGTVLPVEKIF